MNHNERLTQFVEESFLSPLIRRAGVTDISFNGEHLFYMDSLHGRRRAGIEISNEEVGAFLRQIANMSEKQFSYLSPNLDVSFYKYRLNATYLSIGRVFDQKTYSFSLRIGHDGSILMDDETFFPAKTKRILLDAIKTHQSIVIAGETGSGKTELQKYLIMSMEPNTRVVVIDNIGELDRCRGEGFIDLTLWVADERYEDSSCDALIRNSLRNNPDYLIVAESRGKEMFSTLNAVMSGHPIITTLHAKDLESVPYRMARMCQMAESNLVYDDLIGDIYHHFALVVVVSKSEVDGKIKRRISSLGRFNEKDRVIEILYQEKTRGRKAE